MKLKKALPVVLVLICPSLLAQPARRIAILPQTISMRSSRTTWRIASPESGLYMLGQGTKRDPELSRFYAGKAPEQKRDMERDQAAGSAPRLGVKSTRSEPRTAEHKS